MTPTEAARHAYLQGDALSSADIAELCGVSLQEARKIVWRLVNGNEVKRYGRSYPPVYVAHGIKPNLCRLTTVQHAMRTQPVSVFQLGARA